MPLETWTEKLHANHVAADNECATAAKLRESLALAREKCKMDYLAQYEATNYALRRRSYETIRLKTELEYQKKNVSTKTTAFVLSVIRIINKKTTTHLRIHQKGFRPPELHPPLASFNFPFSGSRWNAKAECRTWPNHKMQRRNHSLPEMCRIEAGN